MPEASFLVYVLQLSRKGKERLSCTLQSSYVARKGSTAFLSATHTTGRWYGVLNGIRKAIHGSIQDCKVQDR